MSDFCHSSEEYASRNFLSRFEGSSLSSASHWLTANNNFVIVALVTFAPDCPTCCSFLTRPYVNTKIAHKALQSIDSHATWPSDISLRYTRRDLNTATDKYVQRCIDRVQSNAINDDPLS
ncbi:hypothetical protein EVAR_25617_1 [Eumeta japonica]|uniref:Uncharacterized protein n=1 Tax=Eumeta variegata TaxID=151549 RepID=A0A4C1V244_EUMVA|nr:hypothetical protein EVAR_25617_1 [Eumeta japonica]